MLKKTKNFFAFLIFVVIIVAIVVVSSTIPICKPYEPPEPPKPYVFSTNYTAEEHIQRIEERTADIFDVDIVNEIVKGFTVDIVYSIYENKPEYFVVEVEYTGYFSYSLNYENYAYSTHYKHIMGYIYQDDYYVLEDSYAVVGHLAGLRVEDYMKIGQSPYSVFADFTSKKYYGYLDEYANSRGVYAVEEDNEIVEIATTKCLDHEGCFEIHSEEVAKYSPHIDCIFPPMNKVILQEEYSKYDRSRFLAKHLRYHDDAVTEGPHC